MTSQTYSVRLDQETLKQFGLLAKATHRSRSSVIRWLIWKESGIRGITQQKDTIVLQREEINSSPEGEIND